MCARKLNPFWLGIDLDRRSLVASLAPQSVVARSLGLRDKTDGIDAAVLAVYGAVQRPAPTALPSPVMARLRELSRMRQTIQEELTRWRGRLTQTRQNDVRPMAARFIAQLQSECAMLEEQIERLLAQTPELQRQAQLLQSTPGIGPVVAVVLLAELGDLRDYRREQRVAAAGVYPRQRESAGRKLQRAHLAKGGGSRVRRALYLSVLGLCRKQGPPAMLGARLRKAGKPMKSAMGATMRKQLLIARAVVRSAQPYASTHAERVGAGRRASNAGFQPIAKTLEKTHFHP